MNEVEPRNLDDLAQRFCEVAHHLALSFLWSDFAFVGAERFLRLRCSSTRALSSSSSLAVGRRDCKSVATSATPLPAKTRSSKSPTKWRWIGNGSTAARKTNALPMSPFCRATTPFRIKRDKSVEMEACVIGLLAV